MANTGLNMAFNGINNKLNNSFDFITKRIAKPNNLPDISGVVTRRKKVDASGNIIKHAELYKIAAFLGGLKNFGKNLLTYGLPALGIGMSIGGASDAVNPQNSVDAQPQQQFKIPQPPPPLPMQQPKIPQ